MPYTTLPIPRHKIGGSFYEIDLPINRETGRENSEAWADTIGLLSPQAALRFMADILERYYPIWEQKPKVVENENDLWLQAIEDLRSEANRREDIHPWGPYRYFWEAADTLKKFYFGNYLSDALMRLIRATGTSISDPMHSAFMTSDQALGLPWSSEAFRDQNYSFDAEFKWQQERLKEYLQFEGQEALIQDQENGIFPLAGEPNQLLLATIIRSRTRLLLSRIKKEKGISQNAIALCNESYNDLSTGLTENASYWMGAFFNAPLPSSGEFKNALDVVVRYCSGALLQFDNRISNVLNVWKNMKPRPKRLKKTPPPDNISGRCLPSQTHPRSPLSSRHRVGGSFYEIELPFTPSYSFIEKSEIMSDAIQLLSPQGAFRFMADILEHFLPLWRNKSKKRSPEEVDLWIQSIEDLRSEASRKEQAHPWGPYRHFWIAYDKLRKIYFDDYMSFGLMAIFRATYQDISSPMRCASITSHYALDYFARDDGTIWRTEDNPLFQQEFDWQLELLKTYLQFEGQDALIQDQDNGTLPLAGEPGHLLLATIIRNRTRILLRRIKKEARKLSQNAISLLNESYNDLSTGMTEDTSYWINAYFEAHARPGEQYSCALDVVVYWCSRALLEQENGIDRIIDRWKKMKPRPKRIKKTPPPDNISGKRSSHGVPSMSLSMPPFMLASIRGEDFDPELGEILFETGRPVTFTFFRNPSGAKDKFNFGSRFGQDIEPAGKYMNWRTPEVRLQPGQESGRLHFRNPLVLAHNGYGDEGWKALLQKKFQAKSEALTKKLLAAGYDGVVTVYDHGLPNEWVSEIVALRFPSESSPIGEIRRANHRVGAYIAEIDVPGRYHIDKLNYGVRMTSYLSANRLAADYAEHVIPLVESGQFRSLLEDSLFMAKKFQEERIYEKNIIEQIPGSLFDAMNYLVEERGYFSDNDAAPQMDDENSIPWFVSGAVLFAMGYYRYAFIASPMKNQNYALGTAEYARYAVIAARTNLVKQAPSEEEEFSWQLGRLQHYLREDAANQALTDESQGYEPLTGESGKIPYATLMRARVRWLVEEVRNSRKLSTATSAKIDEVEADLSEMLDASFWFMGRTTDEDLTVSPQSATQVAILSCLENRPVQEFFDNITKVKPRPKERPKRLTKASLAKAKKNNGIAGLLPYHEMSTIGAYIESADVPSGKIYDKINLALSVVPAVAANQLAIEFASHVMPLVRSKVMRDIIDAALLNAKETVEYRIALRGDGKKKRDIDRDMKLFSINSRLTEELRFISRDGDAPVGDTAADFHVGMSVLAANSWGGVSTSSIALSPWKNQRYAFIAANEAAVAAGNRFFPSEKEIQWQWSMIQNCLIREAANQAMDDEADGLPPLDGEPDMIPYCTLLRARVRALVREVLDGTTVSKATMEKINEIEADLVEQTSASFWFVNPCDPSVAFRDPTTPTQVAIWAFQNEDPLKFFLRWITTVSTRPKQRVKKLTKASLAKLKKAGRN